MAGSGYKLFATGDVLTAAQVNNYLQEQTVMVFANAAARTTALASVLSEGMVSYLKDTDVVEIYTGAAWVSLDDPNAIQNSIVTAKGDLIGATAASTPARLAVGTNGQVLTADSTAATGIKWATPASATTFAGCRVYMSAAQSIANNTDVTLNFNTEAFDTDAYHDTVTNNSRITIPTGKAGKYLFNGQINFASNTAGQRWISIKDGTGVIVARSNMMTVNGDTTFINCSGVVNCAVGDYFILQAYQTSGSSINANGNNESTWFSTTYLGA